MITVEIYLFLAAVVAGAFVYMFLDLENRLYGNTFAAGFAAVIAGLLSLWSFSENVCIVETVVSESVRVEYYLNETLQNVTTANIHAAHVTPIVDPILGFFWFFVAAFMSIMFGYFVFEILQESRNPDTDMEDDV